MVMSVEVNLEKEFDKLEHDLKIADEINGKLLRCLRDMVESYRRSYLYSRPIDEELLSLVEALDRAEKEIKEWIGEK